jgi:hypothetical protein
VGFGISNAEHVAQVAEFADAAVIGSAIVELIESRLPRRRRALWLDLSRACSCLSGAGPVTNPCSGFSAYSRLGFSFCSYAPGACWGLREGRRSYPGRNTRME